MFIPVNFGNSSFYWTRTLCVTQVDCFDALVYYKSVDLMLLSFTWLFLHLDVSGTVQLSSARLFHSTTFFCLSFLSVLWHSSLLQFVTPYHCVRLTRSPYFDFYFACIFAVLHESLQFVVTSFNICIFILNKAPFVFQSQPVQVKQLLLASIQHNFTNINYY